MNKVITAREAICQSQQIALSRVNGLGWLEALFGQVLDGRSTSIAMVSTPEPARQQAMSQHTDKLRR